jgi:hypothetical protein
MHRPVTTFWQTLRAALTLDGKPSRPRARRVALAVEGLEERAVPAVLTVTSALDDGSAGTLRAQVAQANVDADNGLSDRIVFAPGITQVNLTQREMDITGNPFTALTIDGGGKVTLNVTGKGGVFEIARGASATISGLTMTGVTGFSSGVVGNQGSLTMDGDRILGNADSAVVNDGGTVHMSNMTIFGNSSFGGGAINNNRGIVNVTDSSLLNNTGAVGGGAVANYRGTVNITDSTLSNNSTTFDPAVDGDPENFPVPPSPQDGGGAILNTDGTVQVTGSTLSNNSTHEAGGAINNQNGTVVLDNTQVLSNTAAIGGAIQNSGGSLTVSGSMVSQNTAQSVGGAINNLGSSQFIVSNSSIAANNAGTDAGGIFTDSPLQLSGSTVSGNTVAGAPADQIVGGGSITPGAVTAKAMGGAGSTGALAWQQAVSSVFARDFNA